MHAIYNNIDNTYKNESKHSKMGPVRQNPIQRTVSSVHMCVCIALCTIVAHNIAHNRPDNFPLLPSRQSQLLWWCLFEGRGGHQTHRTPQQCWIMSVMDM